MDAQPGDPNRDDANDAKHDHDTGLLLSPVTALGELHGDIARVEGLDGRHLCEIGDGARCGRAVFWGLFVSYERGSCSSSCMKR